MISLKIDNDQIEAKIHGSDEIVIDELSTAVVRILTALEEDDGRPVRETLGVLILHMLSKSQQD